MCNVGDLGLIPGLGRSPGEGGGDPFQYSGLENSIVHGVSKSQTQLSDFHFHFTWRVRSLRKTGGVKLRQRARGTWRPWVWKHFVQRTAIEGMSNTTLVLRRQILHRLEGQSKPSGLYAQYDWQLLKGFQQRVPWCDLHGQKTTLWQMHCRVRNERGCL